MALTKEIIQKNVEGLTDEQVNALTKLSENAFNEAISTRIGEIHGQYDADIKSIIGQDKPGGTKTYEWLKSVLSDLKTKAESGSGEIEKYKSEIETLKTQIKDGKGGEAVKQELADAQARLKQLQDALAAKDGEYGEKLKAAQEATTRLKIDYEFEKALTGVKFKPDDVMPEAVRQTFIQAAKAKLMAEAKPDWIDDGKGGQRLVFRNADGNVMNNPDNALNPYSAKELLLKELAPIVDNGKHQPGAGTGNGKPKPSGNIAVDMGTAKSQVEVTNLITDHLMATGLERGSGKFQEEFNKIWSEQKESIAKLPFQ